MLYAQVHRLFQADGQRGGDVGARLVLGVVRDGVFQVEDKNSKVR
jgi:hypothetical protein